MNNFMDSKSKLGIGSAVFFVSTMRENVASLALKYNNSKH